MAIFKAPRITSQQRGTIVLEQSEIVFDTDQNSFYGGNGIDLGGFPLGRGTGSIIITRTVTSDNIADKYLLLPTEPFLGSAVRLTFVNGIEQINGIDFTVTGNVLSWDSLGLDNFIETGDTIIIQY